MERRPLNLPNKPRRIRRRELAIFSPNWEKDVYQLWAKRFVDKNHWRVQHIFLEKEECMSEMALIFATCFRKYYGSARVKKPAHFMALFKTAVNNKWNRLSRTDEKYRDTIDPGVEVSELYYGGGNSNGMFFYDREVAARGVTHLIIEPSDVALGPLAVAIAELPAEAHLVLQRLLEAPAELIDSLFTMPAARKEAPPPSRFLWDKFADARIKRIWRLSYSSDIVGLLRNLIGP